MSDQEKIDHPAHYGGAKDPYEAIKVIRAWGLGFALGNAAKYICRAGRKPGEEALDDLKKARWYLDNEVEALGGAKVSKPLSNPEAKALLARGRSRPANPLAATPETMRGWLEAAVARAQERFADEAEVSTMVQMLDRCLEFLFQLGEVLDLSDAKRIELQRCSYAGAKAALDHATMYKSTAEALRAKEQPMPAVTRVRLEAERDEAIAKAEGLQAEVDELTKAGAWLKKQANEAAAERDEARSKLEEMTLFRDQAVERLERFAKERDEAIAKAKGLQTALDEERVETAKLREAIDELHGEVGTWRDRSNNEREQMNRIRAALGPSFMGRSTAGMVEGIEKLRGEVKTLRGARQVRSKLLKPGDAREGDIYRSRDGTLWEARGDGAIESDDCVIADLRNAEWSAYEPFTLIAWIDDREVKP